MSRSPGKEHRTVSCLTELSGHVLGALGAPFPTTVFVVHTTYIFHGSESLPSQPCLTPLTRPPQPPPAASHREPVNHCLLPESVMVPAWHLLGPCLFASSRQYFSPQAESIPGVGGGGFSNRRLPLGPWPLFPFRPSCFPGGRGCGFQSRATDRELQAVFSQLLPAPWLLLTLP